MQMGLLVTAAALVILVTGSLKAQAAGSQSGHWFYQMDRDKSGSVSRAEFRQFVSRRSNRPDRQFVTLTFNRLDLNHNGQLERNELRFLSRAVKLNSRRR
jgi:Ca2+-binding EF-hand superfamily protein